MRLDPSLPDGEVGVIIGRFQVHELHPGHLDLIRSVQARHNKVLILVGSTPDILVTRNNPLDFFTRKLMLQEAFPEVVILPIKDMPSDQEWSKAVDARIDESVGNHAGAVLYGSRDGFIPFYVGKHPTVDLEPRQQVSGSQIRRDISSEVRASAEFRRGVVYAAFNKHPVAYPTIDVAVLDKDGQRVLLGRKNRDLPGRYRFFGGFVDPTDACLEEAALREVAEECPGLEVDEPRYLGSAKIHDWRYRNELDGISTTLFAVRYLFGPVQPGSDIDEVRWFDINELCGDFPNILVEEHHVLGQMLTNFHNAYLKKERQS